MLSRKEQWFIGIGAGLVALVIAAGQAYGIYWVVDRITGTDLGPPHGSHFMAAVRVEGFDRRDWHGDHGVGSIALYVGSVETDDDGVAVPDRLADLITGPSLQLHRSTWSPEQEEVPLLEGTGIDQGITCYVVVAQDMPGVWPPRYNIRDDLLTPSEFTQFQAGKLIVLNIEASCDGEN